MNGSFRPECGAKRANGDRGDSMKQHGKGI
jgi:hypothetical protein